MTVSVIIPNCGDGETLPAAVASVEATSVDTEPIVVNNDDTLPEGISDDATVVNCPPQPPGHNRNAGLRVATGEYIQFLDADDQLVDGGLAPRVRALETREAAIAVGDPIRVQADGPRHRVTLDDVDDPAVAYLRGEWEPSLGAMLCEREVFAEHRFWERLRRAQDFHLWTRLFAAYGVTTVDAPAFRYQLRPGQRSRQQIHQRFRDQRRACRDLAAWDRRLRAAALSRWRQTWADEWRMQWGRLIRSVAGDAVGSQVPDGGSSPSEPVMTQEEETP